jgi:tetratricopeptide (TPR) repeat protein/tRNA A-37 threonylcarbamoyl transferase component Bud32
MPEPEQQPDLRTTDGSTPPSAATLDIAGAEHVTEIRRRFEEAWRRVQDGAPPPRMDVFLELGAESERDALRAELSDVQRSYERRTSSQPAGTHADTLGFAANRPTAASDRATPSVSSVGAISLGPESPGRAPAPKVSGYELLGRLGHGGMGVVYKARHVRLDRVVALKMVLAGAHATPEHLARFRAESQAVAQLQHPNIVQIHEVGEQDGLPFFSLEYVGGGSLAQKIGGQPRPTREAAHMIETLARAVDYAHRHGVVHRDLKPANILLTQDGVPKVTDFGLAKRLELDTTQTRTGTILGTPSYMAPEQARGDHKETGPLTDVYALGAILYELLTGRPPFAAATPSRTILQVLNEEPVPPTRLRPDTPRDLETVCLKCLQKDPARRYPSSAELADDLHRLLADEPIRARPVGAVERTWRWCRRNPRTAGMVAAIGVLLSVVAVSLAWVGVRASREREAVVQTRKSATERIDQAAAAVAAGDYRRARDLIVWSDPFLDVSPALYDVRDRREMLRTQVTVYAEFKQLLDDARFACRFGSRAEKERGRKTCAQLLALYDQIESQTGPATAGLPPLDSEQLQLFKEDAFEAFLVAALVEQELATDEPARREAANQAIKWLNRAETILPGTRALYVQRAACWGKLGNTEADQADLKRAMSIEPASAVDLFWRGYVEHLRGEAALRKGDTKAAQDYFRKEVAAYAAFVQLRPDNFWGYFNWANCLTSLNDYDDGAIAFTNCIRIRPDFPWPYNNRGVVHHRKGRNEQAVQDCTTALDRNPNYVEARANRGTAYAAMGKTDLAFDDLNRAIELDPNFTPAYSERAKLYRARKQYTEAIRDCDRAVALAADKVSMYLQRAEVYRDMKRDGEAIRDYDRAIDLNSKQLDAYFNRAGLHYARGDYLEARDDYSKVIGLGSVPVAYGNRAIINWLNLKDFDAAVKDWERVIQLDPKNPDPHRYIGSILLGRRRYAGALDSFQKALDRKPGYIEVVWARAQIYLWQGRPKDALVELDPLVEQLIPDKPETLNVRGDVYRAMNDLDRAATDYRRLIGLRPKDTNAYVGLAIVCDKQGRPKEAKECYDQWVAADPNSAAAYLRRAEFRRDHQEFELARADCDQAARLDQKSALPELVRASVGATSGGYREAVERAEAALKNAPANDGHVLYAAACVWSLASGSAGADGSEGSELAKKYADRAAELLGATLDKGFHDLLFPEHNRMAGDPALVPVRSHPKVRELLAGRP